MALSKVSISYKPLRFGFLVRENSIEDLMLAVGINSLLWGGIYNPIIPINKLDNSFGDQLVKLFEVDALHPISEADEVLEFMKKYPLLKSQAVGNIFYADWVTQKKS